jgi:hypothetical protein
MLFLAATEIHGSSKKAWIFLPLLDHLCSAASSRVGLPGTKRIAVEEDPPKGRRARSSAAKKHICAHFGKRRQRRESMFVL